MLKQGMVDGMVDGKLQAKMPHFSWHFESENHGFKEEIKIQGMNRLIGKTGVTKDLCQYFLRRTM